jgi:hypothetical protein
MSAFCRRPLLITSKRWMALSGNINVSFCNNYKKPHKLLSNSSYWYVGSLNAGTKLSTSHFLLQERTLIGLSLWFNLTTYWQKPSSVASNETRVWITSWNERKRKRQCTKFNDMSQRGLGATQGHQSTPVRIDNLKACRLSLHFLNTRRHWKPVNSNIQNIYVWASINKEKNP